MTNHMVIKHPEERVVPDTRGLSEEEAQAVKSHLNANADTSAGRYQAVPMPVKERK